MLNPVILLSENQALRWSGRDLKIFVRWWNFSKGAETWVRKIGVLKVVDNSTE